MYFFDKTRSITPYGDKIQHQLNAIERFAIGANQYKLSVNKKVKVSLIENGEKAKFTFKSASSKITVF